MRQKIRWFLVSVALALGPVGPTGAQQPAAAPPAASRSGDLQAQIDSLRQDVERLRNDLSLLRRENQELRRQLTQQRPLPDSFDEQPPQTPPLSQQRTSVTAPAAQQDSGYWITSSSGKRHNSRCRYYRTSNGHPGGPTDGTPCKVCGG